MRFLSFRSLFVGFSTCVAGGALALASGSSLVACEALDKVSPLPDPDASAEYDAGYVPPLPEEAGVDASVPDAGPPPASGRVRLANLLQGVAAVDVCARRDDASGTWEGQKITTGTSPKADGLKFGEVSAHFFLPVATAAGTKYAFRVVPLGASCEGDGGAPLVNIASSTLRQNGGITLVATGVAGIDGGDTIPRGVALADVLQPPQTAALVRAFHGVPDLPPFDVVVNGETILTGIKYGSAFGFPYTSTTGFATIPAGIPEEATLALRAGTTVKTFEVPERVRRGVAMSIFVSGRASEPSTLEVTLCADRSPASGEELASCTPLQAQ